MNTDQCIVDFYALRRHFTTSYDYHKHRGRAYITDATMKRITSGKQIHLFERLARTANPHNILLANIVANPKIWITGIMTDDGMQVHRRWAQVNQSLTYNVCQEINKLTTPFDANFITNQRPFLLDLLTSNQIRIETVCVLNQLTGFINHWQHQKVDDVKWPNPCSRIVKYTPFIKCDLDKVRQKIVERYSD